VSDENAAKTEINAETDVKIDAKTNVNTDVETNANVDRRSRSDAFSFNSSFRSRMIEDNLR
jgi:hypothetical protein